VLPRAVFRPVTKIFEGKLVDESEGAPDADSVAKWIGAAWRSQDAWLRACAVRASRCLPTFDPRLFATGGGDNPVFLAELEVLSSDGGRRPDVRTGAVRPDSAGERAC